MGLRLLLVAIAALTSAAGRGENLENVPPDPASGAEEVVVSAPEPRYVAPTRRDRIGRVWAPVYLNGKGPFRLVLDTGANRTAVIPALANRIGAPVEASTIRLL